MSEAQRTAPVATPLLTPAAREIVVIVLAVIAIAAPFANGFLAGRPTLEASLELRFVLVVGGAALGLFATIAWRSGRDTALSSRARVALIALGVVPIVIALEAPRGPLWVSVLTLEVLLGGPLVVLAAAWRLGSLPGPRQGLRIAAAAITILALSGPWAALVWGLSQTQLAMAIVRLAHQDPMHSAGEEEVEIPAADGLIVRGTFTRGRRNAPAVVLLHGIADGRTQMAGWASLIAEERGYHALRIDWRAHGTSEGSVCTFADRELLDLDAAFAWLAMRPDIDHDKTLIVGASMGGGIALAAIERLAPRGLRGVVAFAPPSDYSALVARRIAPLGPLAPLARSIVGVVAGGLGHASPFELAPGRGLERGPAVPILIFHGDQDATIPLALSEELAARVDRVELRVLPGVGHDELPAAVLDDPPSRVRVLQFLRYPRARDIPPSSAAEP